MFFDRAAQAAILEEIRLCTIAELDDSAWPLLVDQLNIGADPGTVVTFVEALSAALLRFPVSHELARIASVRESVKLIVESSGWTSGRWRQHANHRGHSGYHSGNIADRPVLTSFVAHLLPPAEQATVDGLRLLMLVTVLQAGPSSTALIQVADASRKSVTLEAWRQVMRSLPAPDDGANCLFGWLSLVMAYLKTATVPVGFANLPAKSIEGFFGSLQQLVAAALQLPLLREQVARRPTQPPQAAEEEAGRELKAIPRRAPIARMHSANAGAAPPDDAERDEPVQEILAFAEGSSGVGESAHLPVVVQDALGSHEQAPTHSAAIVELRHASFRIIQMHQRLLWDWDHLNPFDLSVIVVPSAQI